MATTSNLLYNYTFLDAGRYNFEVISVGYTGNVIGIISDTFYWERKVMMMSVLNFYHFLLAHAFNLIINFFEDENRLNFTNQVKYN